MWRKQLIVEGESKVNTISLDIWSKGTIFFVATTNGWLKQADMTQS